MGPPPVPPAAFSVVATGYDILRGGRVGRRLHRDRPNPSSSCARLPGRDDGEPCCQANWCPLDFRHARFFGGRAHRGGDLGSPWAGHPDGAAAERQLLADSAAVVQLTHQGAALVGALAPEGAVPNTTVIPTCVDMDQFRPSDDCERVRSELGIPGGPVMIYVGSLSTWYLPDLTLRVGDEFARRTGGSFVILTREVEFARTWAEALGVKARVQAVEHHQVPVWLSAADVGLAFVRPDPAKRASAPAKVGEYLACGLAVVAISGVGDLDTQFEGATVACTVPADMDPARVVDLAIEMGNTPDRSNQARALAERYYDLQTGIERYASLYRSLGIEPNGKRMD